MVMHLCMLCVIFSAEFSPGLLKGPYLSHECHENLVSPLIGLFGSFERTNRIARRRPALCFLLMFVIRSNFGGLQCIFLGDIDTGMTWI